MKKIILAGLSLLFNFSALVGSSICQDCAPPEERFAITNYRTLPHIKMTDSSGGSLIAIRRYESNGIPYCLAVAPQTLETHKLPLESLSGDLHTPTFTRYERALMTEFDPESIANQGIQSSQNPEIKGVFLTIDMCQSRKPFESLLFETLASQEKSIPIGLAMTGLWIERNIPGIFNHAQEFSYLRSLKHQGNLNVTWINHSYNHPYEPEQEDFSKNFLSTPGTDFDEEILSMERVLLSYGETPSIFFRFPGLISSPSQIARLKELGLIPLGSNAWLEKGEVPIDGSIILIHGNSNEPGGVKKFLQLFEQNPNLQFNPLSELLN